MTPSPISESRITQYDRTRQAVPIRVFPSKLHVGLDHRVGRNLHVGINHAGCRIEHRDAVRHQLAALRQPHLVVDVGQFGAGIPAQNFARVRRLPCHHPLPRLAQHFRHIGQVVLGVGIVGRKFPDVCVEFLDRKNVETGIDLANLLLRRTRRLFLDDRLHLGATCSFPQHPAVSGRILQVGAQQCHRRLLLQMKIPQVSNRLRSNQRRVARKHNDVVVSRQRLACHHKRMAGAPLLGLQDEVHTRVLRRGLYALGFVADDRVNILRGHDTHCGPNDMLQQRLAADFM